MSLPLNVWGASSPTAWWYARWRAFMSWRVNWLFTRRSVSIAWLAWMYVRCTPSTPGETFRRSFNRTLNSTRLRPDGCKNRGRVPLRRKRIPCRPPHKGKRNWVTELALDDPATQNLDRIGVLFGLR